MPTLLLLRHAQAADIAPGCGDAERPLTERGKTQAASVGDTIRAAGLTVDHVLCSPATRTQETLEGLGLDASVEIVPSIYQAGADTIAAAIHDTRESVQTLLVVGHAPGIPTLAHELAGSDSAPEALDQISTRYPTATLTRVEVPDWGIDHGRVTHVYLTD